MFLLAQMAEVLVGGISQYDGINFQLLHQGTRVLLTGEKTARPPCDMLTGASVVFVTVHTVLLLLSKYLQTIFSKRKLPVIS